MFEVTSQIDTLKRSGKALLFALIAGAIAIPATAQVEDLLLKDFRPQSIYRVPVADLQKARFPVIDLHSHAYAESQEDLEQWVRNMDAMGIEKTIIHTGAVGRQLDSLFAAYSQFG
ncbi:MAG TPA: hypothetical protein VF190_04190, partial [Rhodothermales bacterium]